MSMRINPTRPSKMAPRVMRRAPVANKVGIKKYLKLPDSARKALKVVGTYFKKLN